MVTDTNEEVPGSSEQWLHLVITVPRAGNTRAAESALHDRWRALQLWLARRYGQVKSSLNLGDDASGWPFLHARVRSLQLMDDLSTRGLSVLLKMVTEEALPEACALMIWLGLEQEDQGFQARRRRDSEVRKRKDSITFD